jgi:hypothetical protein
MDLGLQIREKGTPSKHASKQKTPQNFTPKYVKESWWRRYWEITKLQKNVSSNGNG